MSEVLFKKYGRGLFEKHVKGYEPQDPLYEEYVDKKGRTKKRRVSFALSQSESLSISLPTAWRFRMNALLNDVVERTPAWSIKTRRKDPK